MSAVGLVTTVTMLTLLVTAPLFWPPPRDAGRRFDDRPTAACTNALGAIEGDVTASRSIRNVPGHRWAGRRHRRQIAARLPDAVELLVLAVRSGSTPTSAIHDVAPMVDPAVRPAFDAVVHRLERGRSLADAITALPELLGAAAAPVADAVTAADRYGTPLGPVLDGLANDARDDRRRLADAHARRLPVRLSFPLVTCTLPSFVLLTIVPALLGALTGLPASPLAR